jgi:hypothetical protein
VLTLSFLCYTRKEFTSLKIFNNILIAPANGNADAIQLNQFCSIRFDFIECYDERAMHPFKQVARQQRFYFMRTHFAGISRFGGNDFNILPLALHASNFRRIIFLLFSFAPSKTNRLCCCHFHLQHFLFVWCVYIYRN